MKSKRVDVNLKELDQIIDHAREVPLSESESEKLKEALHALAGMMPAPRSTRRPVRCFRPPIPPRSRAKKSLQATDAMALPVTQARRKLRYPFQHCTRAITAQVAKRGKSIHRKNLGRW